MPSRLKDRSILIVEDEPLISMDMAQAFQKAGAEVTTTTTLKQALILVEHDGLSLAILDHALGDGDATRLCERLRERDIPFVIYSGFSKVEGACATAPLVKKPASAQALLAAAEAILPPKADNVPRGGVLAVVLRLLRLSPKERVGTPSP